MMDERMGGEQGQRRRCYEEQRESQLEGPAALSRLIDGRHLGLQHAGLELGDVGI